MKKNRTYIPGLFTAAIFLLMLAMHSCKPNCERNPDDPECLNNEEELITTLKLIVTDSATSAAVGVFQYRDVDGNGTPEVFDTIRLSANKTYKVQLQLLNESVNPTEDITGEVEAEQDEHLFAFSAHMVNVVFSYIDFDSNNLPVGLQTYWATGNAGSGHVTIQLKHQPGVKDGTATPGDTDIEVEFNTLLQ